MRILAPMMATIALIVAAHQAAAQGLPNTSLLDHVRATQGSFVENTAANYSTANYSTEENNRECDSGDASCSSDGCDTSCGKNKWVSFGVEATYLKTDVDASAYDDNLDFGNLGYGWDTAPRIWLGCENSCGWGVRARFWDYDAESDSTVLPSEFEDGPGPAENGEDILISSLDNALGAYAVDLEMTRRCDRGCTERVLSFGARHAQISNEVSWGIADLEHGEQISLENHHWFDGIGLTLGLEGRRPYGCRGFSLYSNVRGSVIWGQNQGAVGVWSINLDEAAVDETLWIGEAQLGLEWSRQVNSCGGTVFARVLGEYQHWTVDELTIEEGGGEIFDFLTDVKFYGVTAVAGFRL